jgi:hypothetical protein
LGSTCNVLDDDVVDEQQYLVPGVLRGHPSTPLDYSAAAAVTQRTIRATPPPVPSTPRPKSFLAGDAAHHPHHHSPLNGMTVAAPGHEPNHHESWKETDGNTGMRHLSSHRDRPLPAPPPQNSRHTLAGAGAAASSSTSPTSSLRKPDPFAAFERRHPTTSSTHSSRLTNQQPIPPPPPGMSRGVGTSEHGRGVEDSNHLDNVEAEVEECMAELKRLKKLNSALNSLRT